MAHDFQRRALAEPAEPRGLLRGLAANAMAVPWRLRFLAMSVLGKQKTER